VTWLVPTPMKRPLSMNRIVADALVALPDGSLRRPNKLVAFSDGDHAVPVADLCGSDTALSDAGNFVADAGGDLADLSTQPISLWVSVPIRVTVVDGLCSAELIATSDFNPLVGTKRSVWVMAWLMQ
jgi:hypothetical protein